jgi:radical SAM protein with 4Fe4S-binding SPASM domain
MSIKPLIDPDTFCPAPWVEAHISVRGNLLPCCVYDEETPFGNVKNSSINTIYNGDQAKLTRKELSNGVKHEGCKACWFEEEHFGTSYRLGHITAWQSETFRSLLNTKKDYSINPVNISRLDLRFDNKCNLKCRICGPVYSTSWNKDSEDLKNMNLDMDIPEVVYSESVNEELFSSLLEQLHTVREIFFAGGEPIIQDKHYEILQHAIDLGISKEMILVYNTNFSKLKYKSYNVLDFWKHFKQVTVGASLDDYGTRAEYQRKNIDWEEVLKNRKAIKPYINVEFTFTVTISIFNVFSVLDVIEEWVELEYIVARESNKGVNISMLHFPMYYSIKNLPVDFKKRVKDKYTLFIAKYKEDTRYTTILPELNKVVVLIDQDRTIELTEWYTTFSKYINVLDKLRNENFYEVFPEYKDLRNII